MKNSSCETFYHLPRTNSELQDTAENCIVTIQYCTVQITVCNIPGRENNTVYGSIWYRFFTAMILYLHPKFGNAAIRPFTILNYLCIFRFLSNKNYFITYIRLISTSMQNFKFLT